MIAKEQNNLQMMGVAKRWIGNTYSMMQDFDQALSYWYEALEISREANDKLCQVRCLGNIISKRVSSLHYNDFEEAEKLLNEKLKINQSLDNTSEIIRTYLSFADLYNNKADIEKAKIAFKYWDTAIKYAEIGLEKSQKYKETKEEIQAYYYLSLLHSNIENLPKARELNDKLIKVCLENKSEFWTTHAFKQQARFDYKEGNFNKYIVNAQEGLKHLKLENLPYPKGDNKDYEVGYKPKVQGLLF